MFLISAALIALGSLAWLPDFIWPLLPAVSSLAAASPFGRDDPLDRKIRGALDPKNGDAYGIRPQSFPEQIRLTCLGLAVKLCAHHPGSLDLRDLTDRTIMTAKSFEEWLKECP